MGHGGGIDADKLDGLELSSIQGFVTSHNSNAAAHANIELDAARITSGTIDIGRLPTGTGAGQVALGDHVHDGAHITSGTIGTDRFSAYSDLTAESKIGPGAAQVAVGNHAHALNDLSNVNAPSPSNNQLLAWSSASSQWQNVAPPPVISDQSASGYMRIGNMQICWGKATLTGTNHVRVFNFTFPATFIGAPVVTNGINAVSSGYAYAVYNHTISATTYWGTIVEIQYQNSGTTVTMNYVAIGRWQ